MSSVIQGRLHSHRYSPRSRPLEGHCRLDCLLALVALDLGRACDTPFHTGLDIGAGPIGLVIGGFGNTGLMIVAAMLDSFWLLIEFSSPRLADADVSVDAFPTRKDEAIRLQPTKRLP